MPETEFESSIVMYADEIIDHVGADRAYAESIRLKDLAKLNNDNRLAWRWYNVSLWLRRNGFKHE